MKTVGPPPENREPVIVNCHCGATIPVARRLIQQTQKCGRCGSQFTVEVQYDRKTRTDAGIPIYHVKEAPPKSFDEAFGGKNSATSPPTPVMPTKIIKRAANPVGSVSLDCTCGQQLLVTREMIGKRVQCPGCGLVMRIEEVKDPQTMVMTLKPKPISDKPTKPDIVDFEEME